MKFNSTILLSLLLFTCTACQSKKADRVYLGNEILISDHLDLLRDKNIGIIANQTSVLSNNVRLVDTLVSLDISVKAIFSPEHGISGDVSAGIGIESSIDNKTGLPVFSLYGKTYKPTEEMLKGIDILLFDIQDIGVRFYTYVSTLYYAMEVASENRLQVIILDRHNPLSGELVAGPVLHNEFKSFVGIAELPVMYGMTIGELAIYFKNELFIDKKKPKITVIPVKGWSRNQNWNELKYPWIPTSPNIPEFENALIYPGTCFLEGTNISEGRGTDKPFLMIGAPFINSDELINNLQKLNNQGVNFVPAAFTPKKIIGKTLYPKFEGIFCNGIEIIVTNEKIINPVQFGINLVYTLHKLYPSKFKFIESHFDRLAGTDKLRLDILSGNTPEQIFTGWRNEIEQFKIKREKYLLY